MGSSSSKPARKLAKDAAASMGAPLRPAGQPSRPTGPVHAQPQLRPMPPRSGVNEKGTASPFNPLNTTGLRGAPASETKTKAVQQDGQDPQLLTNLQKLGAVEVPRGKLSYQRSNPMLNILSARRQNAEAEREAQELAARQGSNSSPATLHNRMSVSTIVAMLDARKECRSQRELEELARGFDIDLDLLQNLARYVNAPSVDVNARARRRQLGVKVEENDEPMERIDAIWTEPQIDDIRQIRG